MTNYHSLGANNCHRQGHQVDCRVKGLSVNHACMITKVCSDGERARRARSLGR